MALTKNINLEYESGLVVPVAGVYIRIDSYSGDKNTTTIYVNTYLSKQHCEDGKTYMDNTKIIKFTHDVSENAPNVIKQGYEHSKTLPDFADATDC